MSAIAKHPLYRTWMNVKQRCSNPKFMCYKNYGGRGITVCDRWQNSFANFLADMGDRPKGHSIDRINNDGNYEPSNCKWSTEKEQHRNKTTNIKVVIEGKEYMAMDIAAQTGFPSRVIRDRAKRGLTLEQIMSKDRYYDLAGLSRGVEAATAKKHAKTHCKRGHEFTPENTYKYKTMRLCKLCRAADDKSRKAAKKASKNPPRI